MSAVALSLRQQHLNAGATLELSDGREIVTSYGPIEEGYTALRGRAAKADLSHRGCLELVGEEARSFLHGQTTNDIEGLKDGQGCRLAFTDQRGRVLADAFVHLLGERLLLDLQHLQAEQLMERLKLYLMLSKAELSERSAQLGRIMVAGPQAGAQLGKLLDAPVDQLQQLQALSTPFEEESLSVLRLGRLGRVPCFHVLAPRGPALRMLWESLDEIPSVGQQVIETVRIEEGIPRYSVDITNETLPQEANMDDALSFDKGCYVGQETIARLHYRGHTNRQLSGLDLGQAPLPPARTPIHLEGKEVGWTTSATHSLGLDRNIALAYLRHKARKPGQLLLLGDIPATVVELPFSLP